MYLYKCRGWREYIGVKIYTKQYAKGSTYTNLCLTVRIAFYSWQQCVLVTEQNNYVWVVRFRLVKRVGEPSHLKEFSLHVVTNFLRRVNYIY